MTNSPLSLLALTHGRGATAQARRDHLDLVALNVEHQVTLDELRAENTRLRALLAEQELLIAERAAAAKEAR